MAFMEKLKNTYELLKMFVLGENIQANRGDHESLEAAIESELMEGGDVPADISYDISKVFSGTLAGIRLGMKIGRKQGKDEGEKAVLKDIQDGKLTLEDIQKMDLRA